MNAQKNSPNIVNFNIIGAGKLGKNIARALTATNQAILRGVINKNFNHAQAFVTEIGCGIAVERLEDLPQASLTFITTPDDNISEVVSQLTAKKLLASGSIVVHCSGVLSSEILSPLKSMNCHVASFHPLKAFRGPQALRQLPLTHPSGTASCERKYPSVFQSCDCVLEGDPAALAQIRLIFSTLGVNLIPIRADKKIIYHAAATISSNYLVTLASIASNLFEQAGIDKLLAKDMVLRLMQSNLDNIRQSVNIASALTGPLARGDVKTLQKHLNELPDASLQSLYKAAAIATLPLTTLTAEQQKAIMRVINQTEG